VRTQLENDDFMQRCAITGVSKYQEKIDWHHNLIFAGRQVNEPWAILPLARRIHDRIHEPDIKNRCDWIMLNRATDDELRPYCKAVDLIRRKQKLNQLYGNA